MIWHIIILFIIDLLDDKIPHLRTVYVYFTFLNLIVGYSTTYGLANSIPGPRMFPIIGSISLLITSQKKIFAKMINYCKLYPNGFPYWSFGVFTYNTYSAESVEKILTNSKNYHNKSPCSFMRKMFGTGLNVSFDSKLVTQRETTIDIKQLNDFQRKFHEQMKRLIEAIRENELNQPDGTDLQQLISEFLLDSSLLLDNDSILDNNNFNHNKVLSAIIFTLCTIANHSDVEQRLFEEITMNADEEDYLNAVVKEVLRLYPPISVIERILGEEIFIDNVKLPAKTTVQIQIFRLHRDPKYFKNPDEFDPDRFLKDSVAESAIGSEKCNYSADHHPFAYIPFGTKEPIEQQLTEIRIFATVKEILKHFELRPITKVGDFNLKHDFVLKTTEPIRIKFVSRVA